jgi:crotonobetainyl-CoA:carnitine CoA-transferase CaiB-like acyl-CoA transferase
MRIGLTQRSTRQRATGNRSGGINLSALTHLRVLELSEAVAGEYCGKLLSDFGADVIKVERPGEGSPTRRLSPFKRGVQGHEASGLFAYLNTNKNSVTLDVASPEGSAVLNQLLDRVDVVIDDHGPEDLERLGIDLSEMQAQRPTLIVCGITAYGQSPPDERRHAHDLNVFHMSGWGYHTPSAPDTSLPPLKGAGRFLVSYEAGLEAALCIVAASYERETSKQGRFIDISKQAVMASRVDYVLGQMVAGDLDVTPKRSAFDLGGPAGIFRCQDGYAYIWLSAPSHWQGLRKLLGDPEWMKEFPDRWLELDCTAARVATCRHYLTEWLKTQEKEKAAAAAQKLGVTLVAVNNARDLQSSPQYAFREFFTEVHHPVIGQASYPTVPYKLSATPARIAAPAPLLGEHTEARLALLHGSARSQGS